MDRNRRSLVARVGLGLAALTTATAFLTPQRAWHHPHWAPTHTVTTEPAGANAGSACQTVDASGVPLVDSQYEQRTGHAPC